MATDILSRGIDIDDITMVVNFDVPHEPEDYVHRIGRTARAGAGGKAVTFVSERDRNKFRFIERFLGYEVRKEDVPAELGYASGGRDRSNDRRKSRSGKPRRKPSQTKADAAQVPASDKISGAAQGAAAEGAGQAPKPKKRRYYHRRKKSGGPGSTPTSHGGNT